MGFLLVKSKEDTMLCTDMTLLRTDPSGTTAEPLRCKRWQCEHCRPKRLHQLKTLCGAGRPDMFITLTANPKHGESPEHRAQQLVEAWRRCRRAAIKRFSLERLPFIAVFEKTKHGEPHLHILCRSKYIPQQWISRFMDEAIGAPVVDIRRIRGKRMAVNYVTKYVGKQPHHFEGLKRYWRSQDYVLDQEDISTPEAVPGVFFDIAYSDYWTYLHCCMTWGTLGQYSAKKAEILPFGDRYRR